MIVHWNANIASLFRNGLGIILRDDSTSLVGSGIAFVIVVICIKRRSAGMVDQIIEFGVTFFG